MNANTELFRPIETKRASEAIYEQVKEKILSGEIKPGERLPSERNMMELFQRSRPTIREALRMLERSGYIRTIPGSNGAVVMLPTEKNMEESIEEALQIGNVTLKEMSEYRRSSEGTTVRWAAERATEEDIAALEACLEDAGKLVGDFNAFLDVDLKFHALLSKAAKNKVCDLMNSTLSKLNRSFVFSKEERLSPEERTEMNVKVHQQHVEIFMAVKAHDVEKAYSAMDEHLTSFFSDLT